MYVRIRNPTHAACNSCLLQRCKGRVLSSTWHAYPLPRVRSFVHAPLHATGAGTVYIGLQIKMAQAFNLVPQTEIHDVRLWAMDLLGKVLVLIYGIFSIIVHESCVTALHNHVTVCMLCTVTTA